MVHDLFAAGLYEIVENNIWLVEEKFYCRGFNIAKLVSFDLRTSLRLKGYLSNMGMQLIQQLAAMGNNIKIDQLKSSLRQIHASGALKAQPAGKLRDPGKIQLWSPIGVVALAGLILLTFILFIRLIQRFVWSGICRTCTICTKSVLSFIKIYFCAFKRWIHARCFGNHINVVT